MVKNLPADAGDTSLIPGLGRYHRVRSSKARVPQLQSQCPRAEEPQLPSPHATTTGYRVPGAVLSHRRSRSNAKSQNRKEK